MQERAVKKKNRVEYNLLIVTKRVKYIRMGKRVEGDEEKVQQAEKFIYCFVLYEEAKKNGRSSRNITLKTNSCTDRYAHIRTHNEPPPPP